MESFADYMELFSNIATIIGVAALLYANRDAILNKKVLNLNVMENCIIRFTAIYPQLLKPAVDEDVLRSYIDLTNEELFYISKKYLTKEVALEWIDGMLTFIPIYNRNAQLINENALLLNHNWEEKLKGYPRIQHFIKDNYFVTPSVMDNSANRKNLVELIYNRMLEYKY